MILLPPEPDVAIQSLVRAVQGGPAHRSSGSTPRCCASSRPRSASASQRNRLVDADAVSRSVARPEDVARALEIARASITVVRNEGGVLPLRAEEPLRLLHLVMSSDVAQPADPGNSRGGAGGPAHRRRDGEPRARGLRGDRGRSRGPGAAGSPTCWRPASCGWPGRRGRPTWRRATLVCCRPLAATGRPLIVVSFGSPYLLRQFPEVPVYVGAYGGGGVEPAGGHRRPLRRVCCARQAAGDAARPLSPTATGSRFRGAR